MTVRPLRYDDFAPRVGQSFTMRSMSEDPTGGTDSCEIVLTDCSRSTVASMPASFNLLFRAGPDAPREQGSYWLSRRDFEAAPIFLVPVRALTDGLEFHAVFNPSTEDENVP
jgi:hypothetical protein